MQVKHPTHLLVSQQMTPSRMESAPVMQLFTHTGWSQCRQETAKQLAGYIRTAATQDLDSYIVGVSLNDNQGVMGAVKLAMDAEKETEK